MASRPKATLRLAETSPAAAKKSAKPAAKKPPPPSASAAAGPRMYYHYKTQDYRPYPAGCARQMKLDGFAKPATEEKKGDDSK